MKFNSNIKVEPFGLDMNKKIENILHLAAYQILGACANFSPIATGKLKSSFTSSAAVVETLVSTPNFISVGWGTPLWGFPQGYGMFVEFDTKPHWAPLQPLINWVRDKNLIFQSVDIEYVGGKSRRVKSQSTRSYKEAKILRIARAIQRKIASRDTKGKRYVAEALATMGLQFQETPNGVDLIYEVDPTPLLIRAGIMERL